MARRLGTWLLGSAALSLGALSSLSGCYSHHTADEDKLDIEFPPGAYDGGVLTNDAAAASDAGPVKPDGGNCGAPGTIQSFLCGLMGGTGGTTPTGGAGTPSIADILNGTQDPSAFGDLLGALTGMGTSGGTSLTDLLAGLGIPTTGGRAPTMPTTPTRPTTPTTPTTGRDAGTGRLGGFTTPTAADCANPTSQLTQVICSMQGGRRDAGAPRPTTPPVTPPVVTPPVVTPPVTTPPVVTPPVVTPPVVTPPEPVDAGAPAPVAPVEPPPVAPVEPAPVTPAAPDVDAGITI